MAWLRGANACHASLCTCAAALPATAGRTHTRAACAAAGAQSGVQKPWRSCSPCPTSPAGSGRSRACTCPCRSTCSSTRCPRPWPPAAARRTRLPLEASVCKTQTPHASATRCSSLQQTRARHSARHTHTWLTIKPKVAGTHGYGVGSRLHAHAVAAAAQRASAAGQRRQGRLTSNLIDRGCLNKHSPADADMRRVRPGCSSSDSASSGVARTQPVRCADSKAACVPCLTC
jgi:hypothetical protein